MNMIQHLNVFFPSVVVVSRAKTAGFIKNTMALCQKGGFAPLKFVCHNKKVLDVIPSADRLQGIQTLDIFKDFLSVNACSGV